MAGRSGWGRAIDVLLTGLGGAMVAFALLSITVLAISDGCRGRQSDEAPQVEAPVSTGMRATKVESSVFDKLSYDDGIRVARAQFCTGEVYDYFDMPPGVYSAWLSAPSKERYFNRHIRGKYEYKRVE